MIRTLAAAIVAVVLFSAPLSAQEWEPTAMVEISSSISATTRAHIAEIASERESVPLTHAPQVRVPEGDPRGARIEARNGVGDPLLALYFVDGAGIASFSLQGTAEAVILEAIPMDAFHHTTAVSDLASRARRHGLYPELLRRIADLSSAGESYRRDAEAQHLIQSIAAHVYAVRWIELPEPEESTRCNPLTAWTDSRCS